VDRTPFPSARYPKPGLDLFEHLVRACFESFECDLRDDANAVILEPQTKLLLTQIAPSDALLSQRPVEVCKANS
jgi:hypothetical protein